MPINPLQLPGPLREPNIDWSRLDAIGDAIAQSRLREREAQAFGGLVESAVGQPQQQPQQPMPGPPGGVMPRGLRNNNPGNIEDGPLAKSLPGYAGSDGRFAKFDSPDSGLNAMDALLTSYGRRGLKTVRDVVSRWAPSSDGNPVEAYARYAGNGNPDAPVDLANPEQRRALALRMAQFENGMAPPAAQQPAAEGRGGMPPELARRVQALFAVGSPKAQEAAIGLVNRYLGKQEPIKLSGDDVLIDPNTYRTIASGPGKTESVRPGGSLVRGGREVFRSPQTDKGETEIEKAAGRRRIAEQLGLTPNHPDTQRFIATGQMPGQDRVSPTQLKLISDAEDENLNLVGTREMLTRALELNPKIFTGYGANIARSLGTGLPGAVVPKGFAETAQATEEWQKIMEPEALQTMARTLKGATTDFELRTFIKQLADPTTTPQTRETVIKRLMRFADRNIAINNSRMDQIRGGTYARPGGGDSANRPPAGTPQQPPAGPTEGATATNPTTGQRIIFRGGQWQPM
jgi:hypothetical protein